MMRRKFAFACDSENLFIYVALDFDDRRNIFTCMV